MRCLADIYRAWEPSWNWPTQTMETTRVIEADRSESELSRESDGQTRIHHPRNDLMR